MKNRSAILILILVILLFHGLNNYIILTKSRYCLGPDSVTYIERTIQIYQALREVRLNLNSIYKTYIQIFGNWWKPPLFYLIASPFLLFGIDKNIVIMSNLIYFAILLFSTYGIGNKLYGFKVGVLSAFLVSMFPTVFAHSRVLMLDFALMAMIAFTFYLFVLNKFGSLKFSLLTGTIIGLSSLTKQSFFIFILPILVYFFLQKDNLKSKKIVRNFIFSIILASLIAATYYARISFAVQHNYIFYVIFQCKDHLSHYFYLQSILNRQLLPVFSLFFLTGLIFCFRKRRYFFSVMVVALLISFSIFSSKQDRFILPIFPYIAVMISNFVWSLSKSRKMLIVSLVLFSFVQYFIISYGNTMSIPRNHFKKSLLSLNKEGISESGLFFIIDEGDWQKPCEEIIKIINDKYQKINKRINVLFIGQEHKISTTIDYLRLAKKLPIYFQAAEINDDFLFPEKVKFIIDYDNRITQSDIIIIEKISPKNMLISTSHLLKAFEQNFDKFNFVKTIPFPNKFVMLYIQK